MENYRISRTTFLKQNQLFQVIGKPHLWEAFKEGLRRCWEWTKVGEKNTLAWERKQTEHYKFLLWAQLWKSQFSDKPRHGLASLFTFGWCKTQENSCASSYTNWEGDLDSIQFFMGLQNAFLLVGIHYRHANKSNKDMFIHYLNIRVFMPTMSTSKELSEETSKTKI